ncbi:hypothetical protein SDC9_179822 [bioreactor metagenome]|uniref:Rod shape-determining protein MreD n=1 Tax=bioreactor metagenome TaxID=1076179 RepID=A0A645H7T7_9ZZZZ
MFIYLLACLLPLPYAMCAAAIGGAVADIIAGYAVYSVFTFVIKALLCLAFTSATVRILSGRNIIGCLICLIITTGGYFLTDTLLFGTAAALGAVIFNLLQAVVSGVVFVVVAGILDKIGIKKIFML